MHALRQFLLLAVLLLGLGWLAMPASALAQTPTPTVDVTPVPASSVSTIKTACNAYAGMTNRIAGCIRDAIDSVAMRFFNKSTGFYSLVGPIVASILTLGIAVYGIMVAIGMLDKIGRDTFMFLMKLSLVTFFTLSSGKMYDSVIGAMDGMGQMVVRVSPGLNGVSSSAGANYNSMICYQNMKAAAVNQGKLLVGPWAAMDCLVDTVFGLKTSQGVSGTSLDTGGASNWFTQQTSNPQLSGNGLQRGMLYFFFSGMKTSVLGFILGLLGCVFMWGLIAMIIKALFTYIAGYIGITFMMIISPLFIPFALFQTTKQYFDKWVKLTISFALQPVIILLFVSFSIAAVDLAMFSGNYSVMYRIAGEESRKSGFNLSRYLSSNGAIKKEETEVAFMKTGAFVEKQLKTPDANAVLGFVRRDCTREDVRTNNPQKPGCADNMPLSFEHDALDWDQLAKIRKPAVTISDGATTPGQQLSREVMATVIFCGIVIFVMNRLMAVVPHMIVDLVGDYGQTPNLLSEAGGKQWSAAAGEVGHAAGNASKEGVSGLATKASDAVKDSFKGLMGQRRAGE